MFQNLGCFINKLSQLNELSVITASVDPYLEIAEIHRKVIAANGPALLFTNVKGKSFPVVTNLFGTAKRVELAFGKDPSDFINLAARLPHEFVPPSIPKFWKNRQFFLKSLKVGFHYKKNAPVLKNQVFNADLTKLPALTSWPEDGGPFLTLPLVHTQGLNKSPDNLGMYRVQIFDSNEAGMHFQIGKGGGFHYHEAETLNKPLPANIYLGGPPALMLSAIAPLPENVPELLLTSLILGSKLKRSKSPVNSIDPIAEAEFAVFGLIPPRIRRPEGPFGDHYGYYSLTHDYPVFRPTAIYHRDNAIFPATIVGKPRQEDFYLGDYIQELLSPLFPLVMPAVKDLWSYGETGYHSLSAACLKERYNRESMSSIFRILGEGQLSLTKFLIATDKSIPLRDFKSVLEHVLARVQWEKDLFIFTELSMDTLDYCGPEINKGSKGALLGMGEPIRTLPHEFTKSFTSSLVKNVQVFCPGCLVVEIPGFQDNKECVSHIAKLPEFREWQLLIAVDDLKKCCRSTSAFLWTTFTRFEPAADIYASDYKVHRNSVIYSGPILIDARMKPWYPAELFCSQETHKLVKSRWGEYFPNKKVAMGSSDLAHL